jgi:hypothetical protein
VKLPVAGLSATRMLHVAVPEAIQRRALAVQKAAWRRAARADKVVAG